MTLKLNAWDGSKILTSKKIIKSYLEAVFEDFNNALFAVSLSNIAKAVGGVTELSKITGLTRAGLYKIMKGERKPEFETIQKILKAFGLKLTVE